MSNIASTNDIDIDINICESKDDKLECDQAKTLSNSWAIIVDPEISCHIENKLLTSSSYDSAEKNNRISTCTSYNIADIVSKNPENIDAIQLLEWQTYLSSNLKKYIKQCAETTNRYNGFDYNLHISKFEWLAKSSKLLSNKLGLTITFHRINNVDTHQNMIPRSSYKFCEYNYDCQFNYRPNYNGCYAQHFVHNLVYADILAIIHYLKTNHEENKAYNYTELIKCITTISYVIKHMYEELSNLQFHYGNIDNVHIERSSLRKDRRNIPEKDNKRHKGKQKYKFS